MHGVGFIMKFFLVSIFAPWTRPCAVSRASYFPTYILGTSACYFDAVVYITYMGFDYLLGCHFNGHDISRSPTQVTIISHHRLGTIPRMHTKDNQILDQETIWDEFKILQQYHTSQTPNTSLFAAAHSSKLVTCPAYFLRFKAPSV